MWKSKDSNIVLVIRPVKEGELDPPVSYFPLAQTRARFEMNELRGLDQIWMTKVILWEQREGYWKEVLRLADLLLLLLKLGCCIWGNRVSSEIKVCVVHQKWIFPYIWRAEIRSSPVCCFTSSFAFIVLSGSKRVTHKKYWAALSKRLN